MTIHRGKLIMFVLKYLFEDFGASNICADVISNSKRT